MKYCAAEHLSITVMSKAPAAAASASEMPLRLRNTNSANTPVQRAQVHGKASLPRIKAEPTCLEVYIPVIQPGTLPCGGEWFSQRWINRRLRRLAASATCVWRSGTLRASLLSTQCDALEQPETSGAEVRGGKSVPESAGSSG